MNTKKIIAEKASQWWRERIEQPNPADKNVSDSMKGVVELGTFLATPSQENLEYFIDCLEQRILFALENSSGEVILASKYGPDGILDEAAEEAGVHRMAFPWGVVMWITPKNVMVRNGEGAEVQTIYTID